MQTGIYTNSSSSALSSTMARSTSSRDGFLPLNSHTRLTFSVLLTESSSGSRSSVRKVPMRIPYVMDMAMGLRNCAWRLVSSINGANPAMVVMVVRNMARNLDRPASRRAS